MKKHLIQILVIVLAAISALAACSDDKPSPMYTITPLPEASPIDPTPLPPTSPNTMAAAPTVTAVAQGLSTPEHFGPITTGNDQQALPPTFTPAIVQPVTPMPTIPPGVTFGPIIDPVHTLQPTVTYLPPTLPPPTITGPSPTPAPALHRILLGVQIHPHIDSSEFNKVMVYTQDLGVTWVKYQFNWSVLESAPGQYTELFYVLRFYVQEAHNQGFKVMISVAKAPGWARTPDPNGQLHENGPPNDPRLLANFLSGMLHQIGTDPNENLYVDAIEVWNEPNLQREWYGYPMTGETYMNYFRPAYDAIRAFSPNITIITAAPAPTGDSDWSTDDRTWFQQLYNGGLAQYGPDVAVGIHPYGWGNAPDTRCCPAQPQGWDDKPQFFFLDTIEDYHQIMIANGHSSAQLWTTEFGWATFDGLRINHGQGPQPPDPAGQPFYSFITQHQQATYTLSALHLAQERPYMGPMILWNLNFATIPGAVDQSNPQTGYGILDSIWQPRPVYQTLKQVAKK